MKRIGPPVEPPKRLQKGAGVPDSGIVYVATGQKFVDMALESIRYLREVEPDESVTLITDADQAARLEKEAEGQRFDVLQLPAPQFGFIDKVDGIGLTPYKRTIFLDADTIPIRPFAQDMYRALDFCNLVALGGVGLNHDWESQLFSAALSQYNTGVLGLDSRAIKEFVPEWRETFLAEDDPKHDQSSFRAVVLRSNLRCGPLPPAFNFMGHGSVARPRILHFTGARRSQSFYKSPQARRQLVGEFAANEEPGFFAHFATASSAHAVLSPRGGGRLSWWLRGTLEWFVVRWSRFFRRSIRLLARTLPFR